MESSINIVIGTRIKELREERSLTQLQLSKLTGISRPNISAIESGSYNVSIGILGKILNVIDAKIEIKNK